MCSVCLMFFFQNCTLFMYTVVQKVAYLIFFKNYKGRYDIRFLVRVKCHDAMTTNEINLFGLARVGDECKTQKDISS